MNLLVPILKQQPSVNGGDVLLDKVCCFLVAYHSINVSHMKTYLRSELADVIGPVHVFTSFLLNPMVFPSAELHAQAIGVPLVKV